MENLGIASTDSERRKTQTRRIFAISFILIGLIIGLGGVADKHYEGKIENFEQELAIANSPTSKVIAMYPANVGNIGSTLYYKFDRYGIMALRGLSYTISSKWLWFSMIIGLFYIWLGIYSMKKKGFLFK